MQCLPTIYCIFQSYAVLHRLQRRSPDKVSRLLIPHCPQTIPGSLLDPNFSSVQWRHWAPHVLFLSFCSSDRERRVIRSHREVTPLCFSLWCPTPLSFPPFSNHCPSPLMMPWMPCFDWQVDGGGTCPVARGPGRGRRQPETEEEAVQSRLWATQQHTGQGPLVLLPFVLCASKSERPLFVSLCLIYSFVAQYF